MNTIKKPPIWFPSLLQIANNVGTHSWFNVNQLKNSNSQNISFTSKDIKTKFIKTKKFIIYPNDKQKNILQQWFHSVINMYNITNNYIKNTYSNNGQIDSFFTLRKLLEQDAKNIISSTSNGTSI